MVPVAVQGIIDLVVTVDAHGAVGGYIKEVGILLGYGWRHGPVGCYTMNAVGDPQDTDHAVGGRPRTGPQHPLHKLAADTSLPILTTTLPMPVRYIC